MSFVHLKSNKIKQKRKKKQFLMFLLFAMPGIIGFLLLSVYPMLRSFYLSFTNRSLLGYEETQFIGLRNYVRAFQDPYAIESLKISLVFTVATLIITNVIGLGSALLLNTIKGKKSHFYRTAFYLPSILPAVSMVLMFSWIFNPATGIVNSILRAIGVENPPLWFQGSQTVLTTLILTSFWAFGAKMVIYLSARQGISIEYYEAAEIDGANSIQKFWYLTFPLLQNVIFYNVLMSIVGGLQVFTEAYVLSGTGEGVPVLFYVVNLYSHAFNSPYQLGYASALAWILFVVIIFFASIYFLINRRIQRKYE